MQPNDIASSLISCRTDRSHSLRHLVRGRAPVPWLPPGLYRRQFWLAQIAVAQQWPKGYWIRQIDKNFASAHFILEGDMTVQCEKRTMVVKAGDGVIIPPGDSILSTGPSGVMRKLYVIPVGKIFERCMDCMMYNHLYLLPGIVTTEFLDLYQRIRLLYESREPRIIPELSGLIYQFIMRTTEAVQTQNYPQILSSILDYIGIHLSRPLTMEELCSRHGIGRTKMKYLFRKYLQTTPGAYILRLKMELARDCLDKNCLLIKEIAANCGFSSQLYFSHVFRKYYGYSPREYMQKASQSALLQMQAEESSPSGTPSPDENLM